MTQNTQTTAERIRNLIFDAIQDSPYGDESIVAAPLGVTIAAEIDGLTAERDEAREQIAALEASNAEQAQMMADGFADAKEQSARLAEARAEVERLRPAAEAWLYKQACEAWDAGKITPFEFAEAHKLYSPQARRAREAKGGA